MNEEKKNQLGAETDVLVGDVRCRSIEDILEQINIYKSEEKRFKELSNKYPNDFDSKQKLYGEACKVFALEWVLLFKNGI